MTKLALYEKKHMKKDKRRLNYFIEDYIYINNFKTRLGITVIVLFFVGISILNFVNEGIVFPKSLEEFLGIYLKPYVLPWVITLIVYTCISTMIYSQRYCVSSERYRKYRKLLKQLDTYEQAQKPYEGETHEI